MESNEFVRRLRVALERFNLDSRLANLAGRDVPDARVRLDHALRLTEEAAHRTLDLVECSGPLAERTAREANALSPLWQRLRNVRLNDVEFDELFLRMDAFLTAAHKDGETVRSNLSDVLLAQSYQDLSGQIIRGVINLVTELESTLTEFAQLAGHGMSLSPQAPAPSDAGRGYGPAIPGITSGALGEQDDVDALLARMATDGSAP